MTEVWLIPGGYASLPISQTFPARSPSKPLTSAEIEVIRPLFLRGLTWDAYLSSSDCCTSLRDRGLAQCEFGFAWLTSDGLEIAIQELALEREDMAA